jgi:hypothetical protein
MGLSHAEEVLSGSLPPARKFRFFLRSRRRGVIIIDDVLRIKTTRRHNGEQR